MGTPGPCQLCLVCRFAICSQCILALCLCKSGSTLAIISWYFSYSGHTVQDTWSQFPEVLMIICVTVFPANRFLKISAFLVQQNQTEGLFWEFVITFTETRFKKKYSPKNPVTQSYTKDGNASMCCSSMEMLICTPGPFACLTAVRGNTGCPSQSWKEFHLFWPNHLWSPHNVWAAASVAALEASCPPPLHCWGPLHTALEVFPLSTPPGLHLSLGTPGFIHSNKDPSGPLLKITFRIALQQCKWNFAFFGNMWYTHCSLIRKTWQAYVDGLQVGPPE